MMYAGVGSGVGVGVVDAGVGVGVGVRVGVAGADVGVGVGAGAGVGAGIYQTPEEALSSLKRVATIEPNLSLKEEYQKAYQRWKETLKKNLQLGVI